MYTAHNATIGLDEVNEHLRGIGLKEVSPRMLIHYGRLHKHGYRSYITINRLDIALAGEEPWSAELQARYHEFRQTTEAELIWGAQSTAVQVESLGTASATVLSTEPPPAGTSVVVRLLATQIERTGTVTRTDRASGRFHVTFDPYSSVPVAALDAPVVARFRIDLSVDAENLVVIASILLALERFLVRTDLTQETLVRVREFSMRSPMEIVILGGLALEAAIHMFGRIAHHRKEWYEGTRAKYEAEQIRLDTDQRRANAQKESDSELRKALEAEKNARTARILQSLATEFLPLGAPGSEDRQRLIEAAKAAMELPIDFEGEVGDDQNQDVEEE